MFSSSFRSEATLPSTGFSDELTSEEEEGDCQNVSKAYV